MDNLEDFEPLSAEQLKKQFGLRLPEFFLLVTFHPVTLEFEKTAKHINELLLALEESKVPTIFTYPNADTQGHLIIKRIEEYLQRHQNCQAAVNLGTEGYFSLMHYARAMVGNSSSGIIEAASFSLPVVNIGNRQRGRIHGRNVIDVPCQSKDILKAINLASSAQFQSSLKDLVNPYGCGRASETIVKRLKEIALDDVLLLKPFYDGEQAS